MAATIPTNGIVLSSGLNVADGDITLASRHGIRFAATGDGTNDDSELFDDFEEGTWTGQYKSSSGDMTMNSTNKYGRYVKIGRMVHVQCYMATNAVSSPSGRLRCTGLPFTFISSGGIVITNVYLQGATGNPGGHMIVRYDNATTLLIDIEEQKNNYISEGSQTSNNLPN